MSTNLPQYPVYVISKGRFESCLTAKFLIKDNVPFYLVVEPQEFDEYVSRYGTNHVVALPFSNLGLGGIPARNWCWEHSKAAGHKRHWILDDNIHRVRRWYKQKRIACNSGVAFKCCEDFVERYENIAIAGLNYTMFAIPTGKGHPPFFLNNHVYSCLLILNELPHRWRGRYNEDTDLCLQVLADKWCTVLFNAFLIEKVATMTMKGGNSDKLYQGDGRLKMARSLERVWPGVVSVGRRFQRPQHIVKDSWRRWDTPLIRRKDIDWASFEAVDEYGMKVVQQKEIKSEELRKLIPN
jgi:hypothetical protein